MQVSRVFEHLDPLKCASLFPSCIKARYVGPYGTKVVPKNVRIFARLAQSISRKQAYVLEPISVTSQWNSMGVDKGGEYTDPWLTETSNNCMWWSVWFLTPPPPPETPQNHLGINPPRNSFVSIKWPSKKRRKKGKLSMELFVVYLFLLNPGLHLQHVLWLFIYIATRAFGQT